jgi:hypothetical protein
MGVTTFTGPVTVGNVIDTYGTAVGTLKNTGILEAAQIQAITQIGTETALATNIVIPANSMIIGIDVYVTTVWNSATNTYTVSVGTSATATELVAATNANAVGRLALSPGADATRTGNWANVGTSDVQIYVKSGAHTGSTGGVGTIIVRYVQSANLMPPTNY